MLSRFVVVQSREVVLDIFWGNLLPLFNKKCHQFFLFQNVIETFKNLYHLGKSWKRRRQFEMPFVVLRFKTCFNVLDFYLKHVSNNFNSNSQPNCFCQFTMMHFNRVIIGFGQNLGFGLFPSLYFGFCFWFQLLFCKFSLCVSLYFSLYCLYFNPMSKQKQFILINGRLSLTTTKTLIFLFLCRDMYKLNSLKKYTLFVVDNKKLLQCKFLAVALLFDFSFFYLRVLYR
eukprot:TRINITY_DN5955_c0_g1_i2.p2 TRINITY_DN5955_c0_g1~~TRINITY_DN5955_c0_g1_i2.p2  ORF type:complete len:229 (-),score=-13.17 TRINITY_DN5955_c0_g1_i2:365-1051(-)